MSSLFERVYKVVKKIPKGKVAIYGQLAQMVGTRDARKVGPRTELTSRRSPPGSRSRGAFMRGKWAISPRIVGFALHANQDPKVPCHRVVDRNGRLAPNFGFSAKSDKSRILGGPAINRTSRPVRRVREGRLGGDGPREQRRRLEAEGVKFKDEMYVDLDSCLWKLGQ